MSSKPASHSDDDGLRYSWSEEPGDYPGVIEALEIAKAKMIADDEDEVRRKRLEQQEAFYWRLWEQEYERMQGRK